MKTLIASSITLAIVLTLNLSFVTPLMASPAQNPASPDVTIHVTTNADEYNTNPGKCSLREALKAANDNIAFGGCDAGGVGTDTIDIAATSYAITIPGPNENSGATGDFDVYAGVVIIQGDGAGGTYIDGDQVDSVFDVLSLGTLTLRDLTIRDGENPLGDPQYGGGMRVDGAATLEDCVVTGNAAQEGGGIFVSSVGWLTVTRTTVSDNTTVRTSGGLLGYGAGISLYNGAKASLTNVTLSGNRAETNGGALYNDGGTVTLNNVTIANNSADSDDNGTGDGGGIYIASGKLGLANTLLADNDDRGSQAHDCSGTVTSYDYNLIEDTAGCTMLGTTTHNITGYDPNLAPLYDYGSGVPTHLLMPKSRAMDKGNPAMPGSGGGACMAVDARGVSRVATGGCDIGAYEYVATFELDSTADAVDADPGNGNCATAAGECTLRAAIQEVANTTGATIYLPAGTYALAIHGEGEQAAATGDLDLNGRVTILGARADTTIVDGMQLDRVFEVIHGPVALINLTVRGGGEGTFGNFGGGVMGTGGPLLLYRTIVRDNRARNGAGVYVLNSGLTAVISSAIVGNTALADAYGGGLYANTGNMVTVVNSTISGNSTEVSGGGVYSNGGMVYLYSSTVVANVADADGDGLGSGGGVAEDSGSALYDIKNTLLGNNVDSGGEAPDCYGDPRSSGYNLIEHTFGCSIWGYMAGNIYYQDPVLNVLQDNGGNTLTHGLIASSPALDAGSPGRCTDLVGNPLLVDQRGSSRARTQRCDIGAFEGTVLPKTYLPLVFQATP